MLTKPPLNFLGNKSKFRNVLTNIFKQYSKEYIFVDLFGGSGYLSYIAKYTCKNNKVIYNDYDHYSDRLLHINETEKILNEIRPLVIKAKILPDKKINIELSDKIKLLLKDKEDKGEYIDWITISSQLCFTMNVCHSYEEFKDKSLYNNLTKTPLKRYDNYLNGLDIVHMDWKDLYNIYKDNEYVIWLIDPPYPNTLIEQYKDDINKEDNLKLLDILHNKNNVFYFTSSKSYILELYNWKYNDDDIKIIKNVNGSGNFRSYYDYCIYKYIY